MGLDFLRRFQPVELVWAGGGCPGVGGCVAMGVVAGLRGTHLGANVAALGPQLVDLGLCDVRPAPPPRPARAAPCGTWTGWCWPVLLWGSGGWEDGEGMPRLLVRELAVIYHPCSCNKSVLLLAWHPPQRCLAPYPVLQESRLPTAQEESHAAWAAPLRIQLDRPCSTATRTDAPQPLRVPAHVCSSAAPSAPLCSLDVFPTMLYLLRPLSRPSSPATSSFQHWLAL